MSQASAMRAGWRDIEVFRLFSAFFIAGILPSDYYGSVILGADSTRVDAGKQHAISPRLRADRLRPPVEISPTPRPRCPPRSGRAIRSLCWLVLASHLPAPAAAADPPWAVENPAGAEARFGVGLGFYAAKQEGLEISSQRTTTELFSPIGGQGAVTTPGDPELLNRKFDPEWKLEGPVAQVPIALRTLGPGGARPLYSAVVLELTQAHVALDIHDRSAPDLVSAFSGDGAMAGIWLELAIPLCRLCPWFAGGGYRYRTLPETAAARSPPFAAPGFTVVGDSATLSGSTHEAFLRWGFAPGGSRFATYAGLLYRSQRVTADDELRLLSDQTRLVTRLVTRTRFESDGALAMAGVEAHLGGRVFGRVEASYGEDDASALVKVVYLGRSGRGRAEGTAGEGPGGEAPERKDPVAERARVAEIAADIAPKLPERQVDFWNGWEKLFPPRGIWSNPRRTEVEALLLTSEADLLNDLRGPELAALRDYVRAEFRQARAALDPAPGSMSAPGQPDPRLVSLGGLDTRRLVHAAVRSAFEPTVALASAPLAEPADLVDDEARVFILLRLTRLYRSLISLAESNDLVIQLCIRSRPVRRAEFVMYPESYPSRKHTVNTDGQLVNVYRGLYLYRVSRHGHKTVESRLDLVGDSRPLVVCELVEASSPEPALSCDRHEAQTEECNDHG